jgi:2-methylcitrate dehydratase PrpD
MAFGIAATEAAGLQITFGSMSKSLNVGRGAENGMLAALFAAKGFTGTEGSIEGKYGYVYATSRQHDYLALTEGLNEHFEISHNTYKPFACGIVIHPVIDAMLQLRSADRLTPADVRSITIRGNPLLLQLTGKKEPKVGLEGKFSVYHSAAVALVRGYAGPAEYTDEAVNDPKVVALRRLVSLQVDPSVRSDEAFVTVTTVDGRTLDKHVEHAIGSLERPLTDSDLNEKYRQLCKNILPESQSEDLLARVWKLESAPDAAELPRLGAKKTAAEGSRRIS